MTQSIPVHPIRPIIILGPTAGGKSDLAVGMALRLNGEILGADSMQVYRHMDAGTAKPSRELRDQVPHHLIDIVEPTERFTVADWLDRAEPLIESLAAAGKRAILVGGTNLYLKALIEGMFEGPEGDPALRAQLSMVSGAELHARLTQVDPASASRIHPNDMRKLVRALEIYTLTGKPISAFQTQWNEGFGDRGLAGSVSDEGRIDGSAGDEDRLARSASDGSANSPKQITDEHRLGRPPDPSLALRANRSSSPALPTNPPVYRHNPILIGVEWPVDAINRRINGRVKDMFFPAAPGTESLPDEVRRLESAGLLGPQAREALGYKQVLDVLAGRATLDESLEKTKILTRRYAKTQRTWLRRYRGVTWLAASELSPQAVLDKAMEATLT